MRYTVGVDFGTLSARAVVVDVESGRELAGAEYVYPHAVIDAQLPCGVKLAPEWALEHPADWREALFNTIKEAVTSAKINPADVVGIGVDATASTPLPVLQDGTVLCELPEFKANPHAWPKLWKHHAAQAHATRINELARKRAEPWLPRYGGLISSEWQFAKALQLFEEAPECFARCEMWVECCDWLVYLLTGNWVRSVSVAGYKGILQDGKLPSAEYLEELSPGFSAVLEKMRGTYGQQGESAGVLHSEAAAKLGLNESVVVAVGNVDAHVTAASAQAVNSGNMLAIMGTSTCHVMNGEGLAVVPGMCGVARGGIVPDVWGYEAGQSGVGDIFAWYVKRQVPAYIQEAAAAAGQSVHEYLTELAWAKPVGAHGLLALDWHGGNRSVLVDTRLSGLMLGQTLATAPEDIYRALVEATAFGARKIVETFRQNGVEVKQFTAAGGLLKNKHLMQTYADVLNMPITVATSSQAPALGSAIHAAVAAGIYPDIFVASQKMGSAKAEAFKPIAKNAAVYNEMFADYEALHAQFGESEDLLMHRLKARRDKALAESET